MSKNILAIACLACCFSASAQAPDDKTDKRDAQLQKAEDAYNDCVDSAQDRYQTKSEVLDTMALLPIVRIAARKRLRENLRAESASCRQTYRVRVKKIKELDRKSE